MYTIENFGTHKLIALDTMKIEQKGNYFYVATMNARDLISIYTVEPAEYEVKQYEALASKLTDDADYYRYMIEEKRQKINDKAFQRHVEKKKLQEIADYIDHEDVPLFPNSIIATCELFEPDDIPENETTENETPQPEVDTNHNIITQYTTYLDDNPGTNISLLIENGPTTSKLYIPYEKGSILVIDGQHRIKGIAESTVASQYKYELLVSFIIGYDRSIIAKQFYTINFTPKKVNRSMLLQLAGEFDTELPELVFLHEVVRVLNEIPQSPFHKRIKMLGKADPSLDPAERQFATVSQAFLINYLAGTLSKKATRSIHQPIFSYYFYDKGINERLSIQQFILKFFIAISRIIHEQWSNPKSIVCKAVCIGAFIRLMQIYYVCKIHSYSAYSPDWVNSISAKEIENDLRGMKTFQFTDYQFSSSAAILNEIKKKLIVHIDFFPGNNYDDFMEFFRRDTQSDISPLTNYMNWFKKNVADKLDNKTKERHSLC